MNSPLPPEAESEVSKFISGFRGLAQATSPLGPTLLGEFRDAERMRQDIERRWLMDLRQYRGVYEPAVLAKLVNRSKSFVKKTRIKVRAIDDRVFDLQFPAGAVRNFAIDPTPEPTISTPQKTKLAIALRKHLQAEPTEMQLRTAIKAFVDTAAGRMASTIDDQLIQAKYRMLAKRAIHDGNLYGTGIIKGPLVDIRQRTRFAHDGKCWVCKQKPEYLPFVDHVPLWRFFPDMTANDIADCRYVWEDHRFTKAALLKLAENPSFNGEAVKRYARTAPSNIAKRSYETEVRALGLNLDSTNDGTYKLLERWGWIDAEMLTGMVDDPGEGMLFCNIWLTPNGEVLKFAPQPIKGVLYPYHLYYFDRDESSIFGEGIATIMRDEQDGMNAARRAKFDNLAITAGPQFEVNAHMLDLGASPTEMGPFSIWWRTTNDGGQFPAIRSINAESHINELASVEGSCDAEIDQVTGIPKFFAGDAPGGAGETARGYSMMLGQANISVKAQVQNFDDGITAPLSQGLVAWNMQFNPDPSIKGDYDATATGTKSLVAKEVRSQTLAQFAGMLTEAQWQYIKLDKLTTEQAQAHDLMNIVKTKEEVEQELNSPAAQMQQQLAQAQQELAMAQMQATVGKLQAEVARMTADAARMEALTLRSKIDSQYAAMQAGALVAANPNVAPIGDAILREAGWVDAPAAPLPPDAVANAAQQVPPGVVPEVSGTNRPDSPFVGENAGIETAEVAQ